VRCIPAAATAKSGESIGCEIRPPERITGQTCVRS